YFPFLVAAVLFAFINLWGRFGKSRWRHVFVLAPMILGIFLIFLDPFSPSPYLDLKWANLREYAILKTVEFQTETGAAAGVMLQSRLRREAASSVPQDSEITTSEP